MVGPRLSPAGISSVGTCTSKLCRSLCRALQTAFSLPLSYFPPSVKKTNVEYVPQLLTATAEIVALSVTVRRWPQAARLAADTHRHARPLRAHRRTWPRECGRPPLCLLCTQRSTPPTCVDSAQRQSEGPALLGGAALRLAHRLTASLSLPPSQTAHHVARFR